MNVFNDKKEQYFTKLGQIFFLFRTKYQKQTVDQFALFLTNTFQTPWTSEEITQIENGVFNISFSKIFSLFQLMQVDSALIDVIKIDQLLYFAALNQHNIEEEMIKALNKLKTD